MLLKQGDTATMYHAGSKSYYEVAVIRPMADIDEDAAERAEITNKNPRHANAAADFTRLARQYGMKPEWLGKSFTWGNSKGLRVVGLLPKKHKNNVLVEGAQGGKYIMPPEQVIDGFSRRGAEDMPG